MRNFPILVNSQNQKLWHQWQQYIHWLDFDITSLGDYIKTFQPNYTIFNDENSNYFTFSEMVEQGFIRPVQLISQDELKSGLIIFAANFDKHQGIINNFYSFHKVYIFYGNPADFDREYSNNILDEDALIYKSVSLQINDQNKEGHLIFSIDDEPVDGFIQLTTQSNTFNVNNKNLRLVDSLFSNTHHIEYIFYQNTKDIGLFQEIPISYYLISNNRFEFPQSSLEDQLQNIVKNYLVVRLAQGGGYYTYSLTDYQTGVFSYTPEAADSLGLTYLMDFSTIQKRYSMPGDTTPLSGSQSISFLSFFYDNEEYTWNIYSNNSLWVNNALLNHEIMKKTTKQEKHVFETAFFDDRREIIYIDYNKKRVPSYKINFISTLEKGIEGLGFFINML